MSSSVHSSPAWSCADGRPGDVHALEGKLDAVGYGFFIPVFFVASGMGLDLGSIAEAPARLLVFFFLLLAVRGLPSFFLYRQELGVSQRAQMTLLTATSLPLLVALAEVGLSSGAMLPENAAALVGAGVLSSWSSRGWRSHSTAPHKSPQAARHHPLRHDL